MNTSKGKGGTKRRKPLPIPAFSQSSQDSVMIRLSGAGDFIDVRFKVDTRALRPGQVYLLDELTGKMVTVASVPKIGRLMTHKAQLGSSAFLLLGNPDNLIKAGSLVTLVIGEYKKEHVPVL